MARRDFTDMGAKVQGYIQTPPILHLTRPHNDKVILGGGLQLIHYALR